jgi:iron-sulfur cluster repair protein YtfE (RIC family)
MNDALAEFGPFVAVHETFLAGLLDHQERLVAGDLPAGLAALERLRDELRAHIAHENTVVLPFLEARGGWSRVGEPRFYREEHEKILALLDRFVAETTALRGDPRRERGIALLIGREQTLRTLLEHHDDRERRALYPDLVRVTTPAERITLLPPG